MIISFYSIKNIMCEFFLQNLISIGLVLDIIGAIMMFFFGVPEMTDTHGYVSLLVGEDEGEAKKGRCYKVFSYVGMSLLILGFGLQLWGNIAG